MFDLVKGNVALGAQPARGLVCEARRLAWVLGCAIVLCVCMGAGAQGPGGGGGHGGRPGGGGMGFPGGGGPGGGFPGRGGGGSPGGMPGGGGTGSGGGGGNIPSSRGTLQRGPTGRWWDESKYAQKVGLTSDQQRRMDGVFAENRESLVSGLDTLRRAEARLNAVSAEDRPSESALSAEIQNVAQARADLEKANTHLVLQIRNEMTQEQVKKMEKLK